MIRHTCNPFHATEAEVAACPGCGAGDNYEGWRAHAEALAVALEDTLAFAEMLGGWDDVDFAAAQNVRAALARLPAQALAERRALETDAARYRYLREGGLQSSTFGVFNGVSYWGGEQLDATLDAVRREGEHHG